MHLSNFVADQRRAFSTVIKSSNNNTEGFYFSDAPGSTGKTFIVKRLLASTATSGIVARFLPVSRTIHLTFKLRLGLSNKQDPICNISKNSAMVELIRMYHGSQKQF